MAEVITAVALALLVVAVIVLVAGLIVGTRWNRRMQEGDWHTRALDACTAADALHEHLETGLSLVQFGDGDGSAPGQRWNDTERSMEQLGVKLHALRFSAPNYSTGQATKQLIMALGALRWALLVQHGAQTASSGAAVGPPRGARARLTEFDASLRTLKAAI